MSGDELAQVLAGQVDDARLRLAASGVAAGWVYDELCETWRDAQAQARRAYADWREGDFRRGFPLPGEPGPRGRRAGRARAPLARRRRPAGERSGRRLICCRQDLAIAGVRWIGGLCVADGHALGERVIGAEVSLGHPPTQRHLGASDPRVARLTERVLLPSGTVDLRDARGLRVVARLALRLGRTLGTPPASAGELLAATERALPCLEVTHQRSVAALLVGDGGLAPAEGRLRRLRIRLEAGVPPELVAAWSNPIWSTIDALHWLAGQRIEGAHERGQLLVGPALTDPVALVPGMCVTARFPGLGTVRLGAA